MKPHEERRWSIATKFRGLRKEMKLSQQVVAEGVGKSTSWVAAYEFGKFLLNSGDIAKLATVFKLEKLRCPDCDGRGYIYAEADNDQAS